MANFGRYETIRDLFRGGLGTVSVARATGKGGKDEFVVKSMHIGDTVQNRADAQRLADSFSARVQVMTRLTEAKARWWAPIHESGVAATGAFYVTDRYPRSLEGLIGGRVRLDGAALYNIASSIVEGLDEIQRVCGRGHGELKPTNCMLDRIGQVDKARVILTDPAPKGTGDAAADQTADLQALGRLIYQLVNFQPFRELGGWPVGENPAWGAIGRNGKKWRELCNKLLNPGAAPGSLLIAGVREELKPLRERKGKGPGGPVKLAAVLLVLAGAGAGLWFSGILPGLIRGGPAPAPVPIEDAEAMWKEWHYGLAWLYGVATAGDSVEVVLQDPTLDPGLKSAIVMLRDGQPTPRNPLSQDGKFDDDFGVAATWVNVVTNGGSAPAFLKSDKANAAARQGGQGILALRRKALAENWSARKVVVDAVVEFEGLGWTRAADELRTPERQLQVAWNETEAPEFYSDPSFSTLKSKGAIFADRMRAIVEYARRVAGVQTQLASLEQNLKSLQAAGVPVEERIRPALRGLDASAAQGVALQHLEDALGNVSQSAADLLTLVRKLEGGALPPNIQVPQAPTTSNVDDLAGWFVAFGGAVNVAQASKPPERIEVPVPQESLTLLQRADAILRQLDELTNRAGTIEDAGTKAGLQRRINDQRKLAQRIRDDLDSGRTSWPQADDATRQSFVASFPDWRRTLDDELSGTITAFGTELVAIARNAAGDQLRRTMEGVQNISALGLPAINEAFESQKRSLLDLHRADGNDQALRSGMQHLQEELLRLEKPLDAAPALSVLPGPLAARAEEVRREVGEIVSRKRNEAAAALIEEAQFSRGSPREGFDPARAQAFQEFSNWVASVDTVLGQLKQAEDLMERAYRADEAPPGGSSWSSALSEARQSPAWADLAPLASTVEARAAALDPSRLPSDSESLEQLVRESTDFPRTLLAWRALIDRPDWRWSDNLKGKMLIYRNVRRTASNNFPNDPDRAVAVVAEIERGGTPRFRDAVESARSEQELRDSTIYFDAFPGIQQSFSPRTRANLATSTFTRAAAEILNSGGAEPKIQSDFEEKLATYKSDISSIGDGVPEGVAPWIASLEAAMQSQSGGTASRESLADVGPGLAGWALAPEATVEAPVYTRTDSTGASQRLAFRRLEDPAASGQSVYLGTTEVSVGMFRAIAESNTGWDRFLSKKNFWRFLEKFPTSDNQSRNIRSWRFAGGALRPDGQWLGVELQSNVVYPAAITAGRPGESSPLQFISIDAAKLAAEGVGCRLPSPADWSAALAMESSQGTPQWNLRDATFQREIEHVRERVAIEAQDASITKLAFWPDDGTVSTVSGALDISTPPAKGPNATVSPQTGDDGSLWFDPVDRADRGAIFKHLVGNVAEFVSLGGDQFGVIGGSAVWPPELGTNQAYTLKPLSAMLRGRDYSDVGFRLAFDAQLATKPSTLAERVRPLIQKPVFAWAP